MIYFCTLCTNIMLWKLSMSNNVIKINFQIYIISSVSGNAWLAYVTVAITRQFLKLVSDVSFCNMNCFSVILQDRGLHYDALSFVKSLLMTFSHSSSSFFVSVGNVTHSDLSDLCKNLQGSKYSQESLDFLKHLQVTVSFKLFRISQDYFTAPLLSEDVQCKSLSHTCSGKETTFAMVHYGFYFSISFSQQCYQQLF